MFKRGVGIVIKRKQVASKHYLLANWPTLGLGHLDMVTFSGHVDQAQKVCIDLSL